MVPIRRRRDCRCCSSSPQLFRVVAFVLFAAPVAAAALCRSCHHPLSSSTSSSASNNWSGRRRRLAGQRRADSDRASNDARIPLHLVVRTKDDDSDETKTPINLATSPEQDRLAGIAVLLTVPLAWGTYTPVVKFLYAIEPPVPGLVFSALYYSVAAVSLWVLNTMSTAAAVVNTDASIEPLYATTDETHIAATTRLDASMLDAPGTILPKNMASLATTSASDTTSRLYSRSILPWRGGIELGSYLFVGNLLQLVGLLTVPADRAGFLVQLTTVIVPILQSVLLVGTTTQSPVSIKTWIACLIALTGVVVINADDKLDSLDVSLVTTLFHPITDVSIDSLVSFVSPGDGLILAAAVVYSLHVVRLERYAQQSTPLQLATAKATVEAALSTALVAALGLVWTSFGTNNNGISDSSIVGYVLQTGKEMSQFFETISTAPATASALALPLVGAVLWTGWVTCAYTIYAQSFGQSRVQPTDANLVYSVQPLCTALFAYILLGETLGPAGVLGGSLIATAVVMVATSTATSQSQRPLPQTNSLEQADLVIPESIVDTR